MFKEPDEIRAISFIDGQNLFRRAMEESGQYHPNYRPRELATAVCTAKG